MKSAITKYGQILYVQVLIGIALGVLAGWLFPSFAPAAKLISETFINMIRMVIAPVIFLVIVSGVAGANNLKQLGRVGGKAIIYFEVVTTIALVIGLVMAKITNAGSGLFTAPTGNAQLADIETKSHDMNWGAFFSHIVPSNIVESFAKGDILQIFFFGVLFAIALKQLGKEGASLLTGLEKVNKVLFNILNMVIKLSPLGAFGGMAYTIGKFGFGTLAIFGKLLVVFYGTCFLFVVIVLNLICRYNKINLWNLLAYIKEEILIVLGSSSSEAVLPMVMQKLEDAGCSKEVVGLVIPSGYSFNLDGMTIYLSMGVIFLSQVFHVHLTFTQELTIIGLLFLTSKGAAGVSGSAFIVLASTLTTLKVIPLDGLALLLGVDWFMGQGRAIVNFIGNTVATVVIAKNEKAINMEMYNAAMAGSGVQAAADGNLVLR